MAKRTPPEINAGSMADIAFLLLIFFLVTTTIAHDKGITKKLPPWLPDDVDENDIPPIKEKNIFTIMINGQDQLLVEDKLMTIRDIRANAKLFILNNGDGTCEYCWDSKKDPGSSDNPIKAVISIQNNRLTSYNTYVAVQNEMVAVYDDLREEYAKNKYGKSYEELSKKLREEIKDMFPQKISEAEPVR